MATRQRRKSYLKQLVIPVIAAGFIGYFAYHARHGSFGTEARAKLDIELRQVQTEMDEVRRERAQMEKRVGLLRAHSLESDMLDERVREILGFAQDHEIVIYKKAKVATR